VFGSLPAFSLIRVRSLAILPLPLCVVNVCPSASICCVTLHSIGIAPFHRYTGPHPPPPPFAQLPFGCLRILDPSRLKRSRVVRRAWLLICLVVLLDAVCDPGGGAVARLLRFSPL